MIKYSVIQKDVDKQYENFTTIIVSSSLKYDYWFDWRW
jgi:phosphoenolpyruvate carboxylase